MAQLQTKNLILRVENYKLLAYNPSLTENQEFCFITADESSSQTTISIDNASNFSNGDFILIGEWGEPTAEIATLTSGGTDTTIVLSSGLKFDHFTSTKIRKIPYTKVEFARASTLTGSKSQLGTDVDIMTDRLWTEYQDDTNSTGYAFFRFTDGSNDSEYSGGVLYSGNELNTAEQIARRGVKILGINIGDKFASHEELINDVREAQDEILQKRDWPFEEYADTLTSSINEFKYNLSDLTFEPKETFTKDSIFSVIFGTKPLIYISPEEMDDIYIDKPFSPLTATATVGATSITLEDSFEFADEGVVYVGNNTVTYTANDTSTGILSGIPSSGTGSITTEVASGTNVFQDFAPGEPSRYTINNEQLVVDIPIDTNLAGYKFKINYIRKLNDIEDFTDIIAIPKPFYSMIAYYVAASIQSRQKNTGIEQSGHYATFFRKLEQANINKPIKLKDVQDVYIFQNDIRRRYYYQNEITNY